MYLNVCFITTTTDIFYMWHCIFTQFEAGTEPPYSLACVACGNFIFTSVMWNISKWNLWEFISQKWSTHTYMKERTRKGESLFIYSRTHSCWTSLEYSLLLKLYACDFGRFLNWIWSLSDFMDVGGTWMEKSGRYISEWS